MNRFLPFPLTLNDATKADVIGRFLRWPIFFCLSLFFFYVARHRLIDGDEGFYLQASRLVMEHKLPYVDFFFTQAPLLPYAYGLWMKLFGMNWYAARGFSAVMTTLLGMLVYEHVYRETRKWSAGVVAVILFASSTYIFAWFPIAKTFSLAGLLLFFVYMIIARVKHLSSFSPLVIAGILFGLSVDTRLFMIGFAPLFVIWIFLKSNRSSRFSNVICFTSGLVVGLAPIVFLFVVSPSVFWFNNLGYHTIRSNSGLVGNWRQKFHEVRQLFLGEGCIQFVILLFLSLSMNIPLRGAKDKNVLALLIAFVFGCLSVLPTPTYLQYFCMVVPYLIVASVCATNDRMNALTNAPTRHIAQFAALGILLIFAASGLPSFRRYLFTGQSVIGIESEADARNWTLANASGVSEAIDRLVAPNETIASFWPGYTFASRAKPLPGLENDFGRMISYKLTPEQIRSYHNITRSEIETELASHAVQLVVLGNQPIDGKLARDEFDKLLRSDGYVEVQNVGDTHIYALPAMN